MSVPLQKLLYEPACLVTSATVENRLFDRTFRKIIRTHRIGRLAEFRRRLHPILSQDLLNRRARKVKAEVVQRAAQSRVAPGRVRARQRAPITASSD